MRSTGALSQAGLAFGAESGHPAMSTLARDPELLRDVSHRTTVVEDPLHEQTTAMQIQTSVNVGHEDLLGQRMT